jgi:hypothetical protein
MADSFFKLDETPTDILTVVFEYKQRQKILSHLPQYTSLPPLARYADGVARTYRTFGEKNAFAEIKKHPETPKGKSLAYAFLLAFRKGTETKWKYSKEEIEYGEFLTPYARALLDATPDSYSKVLQELLTVSGSSEIIPQ